MIETTLKLTGLIFQMIGVMTIVSVFAFAILIWMDGRGRDE